MAEYTITPRSDDSSNHHLEVQMLSKNHNNEIAEDHHHAEHNAKVEDDVAIDIKALQDKNESLLTENCISIVPHEIRTHKPEAYTPHVVSIGPLHYGNTNFQKMEKRKLEFFNAFKKRSDKSLDNLLAIVENSEQNIRECYSEDIKFNKNELSRIILVDAGFIIELFLRFHEGKRKKSNPSTQLTQWIRNKIILDLIMLENQLPFFILEKLFNLALPPQTRVGRPSFLKLTFMFFKDYNVQKLDPSTTPDFSTKHFTDLLRTFHLKQKKSERISFKMMQRNALLYGANELHEAGVKFKVNTTNKCLLDLNFSRGVLEVPQVMVTKYTEYGFRNMIALEQCHYPSESYICDYAVFWDWLLKTSIDVDILVRMQIIPKSLANKHDNVAQVLNSLCKDISHMNFDADYVNVCKKLNAFCKNRWNNMKAALRREYSTLRQDYGKTPWQTIASIAGIVLLILTLVQTICSIIQLRLEDSKFA